MSRDLLLVAISLFAWGMGESTYILFQPLYLAELGASPVSIGTILGIVGIAKTLAHIPAGYLADRFGRRIIMWSAWILGVVSGIIMASARSLPTFTAGATIYGITAFVIAPMNSYITAARGKWTVARAITFTQVFYTAGAIFGPLLGGLVGNTYGYATIYVFATSIFAVSTIIIFFIRSQPIEKRIPGRSSNSFLNRKYFAFLPVIFIAYLGMYLAQPLAPNFLQEIHNLSLQQIGMMGSINNIGSVVSNLGLGALNASSGFILGQVIVGMFPLLLWQGSNLFTFALAYFLLGGFRAAGVMAIAQLRGLITTTNMGLAFGIAETTTGLSLILAPVIAGFLYTRDPFLVFQTAMGLIIFAVAITFMFNKWSSRSDELAIRVDPGELE